LKLTINNIGKLKNAEVEINGITVIAGENNTGKSTVGKSLWALFNGLYKINEQIFLEKLDNIEDVLEKFYRTETNDFTTFRNYMDKVRNFKRKIYSNRDWLDFDENKLKEKIKVFFGNDIEIEDIDELSDEILQVIKKEEEKIIQRIIQNRLRNEFNGQINNLYSTSIGELILEIKKKKFEVKIFNEKVEKTNIDGFLNTEVLYIDTPDVVDSVGNIYFGNRSVNHKEQLEVKISDIFPKEEDILTEVDNEEKLKKIYSELDKIIGGKFIKKGFGKISYIEENSKIELNIKNLSTGIKTFVILKILLDNGSLKKNGTIILDEPEIHLHPEWQIKFAELIILLQKEFGMHILLTTHSPYFLNAIEVFSERYRIEDKCKYYVAENQGNNSIIKDITDNTREIYRKMARPIQDLENIRYSE
jgi:ABC transporter, ATP-binding protein